MTITQPLIGRTCEVAVAEVHGLHAVGEQEVVDGTCEKGENEE